MYIDLVFVLFALYGFWMGYRKGLVRTIFSFLSFFVGLLLTLKLSPYAVEFLQNVFELDRLLSLILGFLLCLFFFMGIIKWIGKGIEKMLMKSKMGVFNKVQGGIILSFLMMVVYSVIIWFLDRTNLISDIQRSASITYPFLESLPGKMQAVLADFKPIFEKFWDLVTDVIKSRGEQ